MNNLTVKGKIYIAVLVTLTLFFVSNFYSKNALKQINDATTVISKQVVVRANLMGEIPFVMAEIRLREYRNIVTNDQTEIKNTITEMQDLYKKVQKDLDAYEKLTTQKQMFEQVKSSITEYMKVNQEVSNLNLQGKKDLALALMVGDGRKLYNNYRELSNKMLNLNTEVGNQLDQKTNDLYEDVVSHISILSFAVLVIICIGSFLFIKTITNSIKALLTVAESMSKGDLRNKVNIKSNDEFAILGKANNIMIDNLKELIMHIQRNSEQVAASAQELNAGAEQSALVTNQVAESITDVSAAANRQINSLQSTTTIVENITGGLDKIAKNANNSMLQANDATQKARIGEQQIENAITQMSYIENSVTNTADLVSKLGERSKEIGQIVDTIDSIAGQTNLLALNAAIEAARAGEQGRGFAVVAEEVRKLAEQSQDATKQISTLIGSIQSETQLAVISMDEGTNNVKAGSKVVAEAGCAFREIVGIIDQVSYQATQVNSIISDLANSSQEVVRAVEELNTMGKSIGDEAQSVSAATEEQSASMQEIASASRALAAIAQTLQESTQKFVM